MDYSAIIRSMLDNQASLYYILPALIIAGTLIATLLLDCLIKSDYKPQLITYMPIGGLCFALYGVIKISKLPELQTGVYLFNHLLQLDSWSTLFHLLLLSLTLLLLYMVANNSKNKVNRLYQVMLLGSLLGAYFLVMANHWLVIYTSLALMSVSSAVLIFGDSWHQSKALPSFQYLFYQAIAGAMMLWGMSYWYATTGTFSISLETSLISFDSPFWLIGFFLSFSALLLQLGAFPFHFWIADVYQNAPMPVVAYLATVPKLAAVAIITRIYNQAALTSHLGGMQLQNLLTLVAIITLVIGHIGALRQSQFKQILAYGSIAQGGLLLASLVASNGNYVAIAYYSIIYGIMSLAVWLSLQAFKFVADSEHSPDYAGLGPFFPVLSSSLCIALLALIGLPPTAGFTGKLLILAGLWTTMQTTKNWLIAVLWLISLLGSVLSLYYYLKLPYILFFKPRQKMDLPGSRAFAYQLIWLLLPILLIGLFFFVDRLVYVLQSGNLLH